ncbi:NADH oxidase [Ligilactobacillus equi DPC 6820]|uniref:NADH oxidase n=2 Tax=Ligilactobacillus equi TaxID=137357 RepID=V7HWR2_9LACO|nr:NADH oxidase [Ligilactobacillus equi DPC 6820]
MGELNMSKILIVGANHTGIAAANTLLSRYPGHEITIIDQNDNISYLGCGTVLWLQKYLSDFNSLFYTSADDFKKLGVDIHLCTQVIDLNLEQKIVTTKDLATGENSHLNYDKLLLATGSLPIAPQVPGLELRGISYIKFAHEVQNLDEKLADESKKTVAVIGAGYIGVELAEALQKRGKKVLLFDKNATCLSNYFDPEFAQIIDNKMKQAGIERHYQTEITAFNGQNGWVKEVVTQDGKKYTVDLVVNAIGFRPNTNLVRGKLDMLANGAILVNEHQESSHKDVFAAGDCATSHHNVLDKPVYIALASHAIREGILAGHGLAGGSPVSPGSQGANSLQLYDTNLAACGLTLETAKAAGFQAQVSDYDGLQELDFMKSNFKVKMRLVYDQATRRLLGAQLAGNQNVTYFDYLFSLALQKHMTIDELAFLDLPFNSFYSHPYNSINLTAQNAQ